MEDVLQRYRALLGEIDDWFDRCVGRAGLDLIACRKGCSACCRGLFEITLLDARLLQEGFSRLPRTVRAEVLEKARPRLAELAARWPGFGPPYLLNGLPEEEWENMPEDDMTPCPLLDADGRCLVYAWRPMTCRLHGLPNIDLSGESFADTWCTMNFKGADPLVREDLRWAFRDNFAREFALLGEFATLLFGKPVLELDTFIPTALFIDFEGTDWKAWLERTGECSNRSRG